MDEPFLREVAQEHLVPLFSGSEILPNSIDSDSQQPLVAFIRPDTIAFKAERGDRYRLVLTRPQPFAKARPGVTTERAVVEAFAQVLESMARALEQEHLRHDLLSTFQRRVVARAVSYRAGREQTLLAGIDQLISRSERLYEGLPISAAIGFKYTSAGGSHPLLEELSREDFNSVLSNGFDTLIEFSYSGRLLSHQSLSLNEEVQSFAPYRQAAIAEWTAGDEEHRRRVAMCLNRNGEILVFRGGKLEFVRRSGVWSFLTHSPVIAQMRYPNERLLRQAVYETCLDASFARTGACIGVISHAKRRSWRQIVDPMDEVSLGKSLKSRTVKLVIGGARFDELDRRARQELSAVDGATIISHEGQILAVGAILEIASGSAGGGRLAAARALGRYGLGIKVSQDGGISGFRGRSPKPAFRIM